MKKFVCVAIVTLLPTFASAQQLSPSQIALAQMAAAADAYKIQMDRLSAENTALQKKLADLKSKCGDACKDAAEPNAVPRPDK